MGGLGDCPRVHIILARSSPCFLQPDVFSADCKSEVPRPPRATGIVHHGWHHGFVLHPWTKNAGPAWALRSPDAEILGYWARLGLASLLANEPTGVLRLLLCVRPRSVLDARALSPLSRFEALAPGSSVRRGRVIALYAIEHLRSRRMPHLALPFAGGGDIAFLLLGPAWHRFELAALRPKRHALGWSNALWPRWGQPTAWRGHRASASTLRLDLSSNVESIERQRNSP